LSSVRPCSSRCRDFACNKKALVFRGKTSWCQWLEEECTPNKCTFALCLKRQLLDNGNCGFTIKRRTRDDETDDFILNELPAKGKLAKKIGDRSIY
jgi:hypothetical protein